MVGNADVHSAINQQIAWVDPTTDQLSSHQLQLPKKGIHMMTWHAMPNPRLTPKPAQD